MTRRTVSDRLARLEELHAAEGLDADLLAILPSWWAHLTDGELEAIAAIEPFEPGCNLPSDPAERAVYCAIEAVCLARGAA